MKPKQRVAELEALLAEKDREIARLKMELAFAKTTTYPVIPYVPTIPSDRTWYPRLTEIWCSGGTMPAANSFKVAL